MPPVEKSQLESIIVDYKKRYPRMVFGALFDLIKNDRPELKISKSTARQYSNAWDMELEGMERIRNGRRQKKVVVCHPPIRGAVTDTPSESDILVSVFMMMKDRSRVGMRDIAMEAFIQSSLYGFNVKVLAIRRVLYRIYADFRNQVGLVYAFGNAGFSAQCFDSIDFSPKTRDDSISEFGQLVKDYYTVDEKKVLLRMSRPIGSSEHEKPVWEILNFQPKISLEDLKNQSKFPPLQAPSISTINAYRRHWFMEAKVEYVLTKNRGWKARNDVAGISDQYDDIIKHVCETRPNASLTDKIIEALFRLRLVDDYSRIPKIEWSTRRRCENRQE
jgi:hypothetical protein